MLDPFSGAVQPTAAQLSQEASSSSPHRGVVFRGLSPPSEDAGEEIAKASGTDDAGVSGSVGDLAGGAAAGSA